MKNKPGILLLLLVYVTADDGCSDDNKWMCILCDNLLQRIDSTTALSCVIGTRGLQIKDCFVDIDKYRLTRYKHMHHFKAAKKVLVDYFSNKVFFHFISTE